MEQTIHFYRAWEPYGCFSNFAAYPIELKGKTWPTSEHYYQAQKHAGTESSTVALHSTRVLPASISTEPSAYSTKPGLIRTGRNSSHARPSLRIRYLLLRAASHLRSANRQVPAQLAAGLAPPTPS